MNKGLHYGSISPSKGGGRMETGEDMITKEQMQNLLDDLSKKGMSYDDAISVLLATIGLYWEDNSSQN